MVYAEILAGGVGSRTGLDIPKQFIKINNKEIILYTIDPFYKNSNIDKIIICVNNEWREYLINIIKKDYDINKFCFVESGNTRKESMINGCDFIKNTYDVKNNDIIMVCDSVRMFVSENIINNNLIAAKEHDAVGTFFPVCDTIIHSIDNTFISDIPTRKKIFHGQCPETFNLKKLIKYYYNLSESQKENITDTSKIFFLNNEPIYMVKGDPTNIKITYSSDIEFAKTLLKTKGIK